MSSIPEAIEVLKSMVCEKRIVNFFYVSSTTFFIYEYLLTIDAEVNLVWNSRWTATKCLFLINRYISFINVLTVLLHQFLHGLTDAQCKWLAVASSWLFVVGCGIADIILTLRTWAIWRKSTRVGILFSVFFILSWASMCVCVELGLQKAAYFSHPDFDCVIGNLNQSMSIAFGILVVYDLVLLTAIVINMPFSRDAFLSVFSDKSSLSQVVCRDGVLYYVILTALSIVNLILILRLQRQYQLLVVPFEGVVRSALTSRVVLNIRLQAFETTTISQLPAMALDDDCIPE